MMTSTIGDLAPDFTAKDHNDKPLSLHDFKGKMVVLYFYPKDDTPGCTIEARDFTALQQDFEKAGAVILGVSKDSCTSHQKFIAKKNLTITLISDPDATVQKMYGVWGPKKFMGRAYLGTLRTTFLINKKGIITNIWQDVNVKEHAQDVLDEIKKM